MEYTLYLKPQFPELKKPKQNRVKSRIKFCRNMFIESIERLLFITAVLEVFFFYAFHYIAKLQTEQGAETFTKDLAL